MYFLPPIFNIKQDVLTVFENDESFVCCFGCNYYPYIALRPYMDQAIVLAYHISDPG